MNVKAVLVLLVLPFAAVLANAEASLTEPVLPESLEWFSPPGNPGLKETVFGGKSVALELEEFDARTRHSLSDGKREKVRT